MPVLSCHVIDQLTIDLDQTDEHVLSIVVGLGSERHSILEKRIAIDLLPENALVDVSEGFALFFKFVLGKAFSVVFLDLTEGSQLGAECGLLEMTKHGERGHLLQEKFVVFAQNLGVLQELCEITGLHFFRLDSNVDVVHLDIGPVLVVMTDGSLERDRQVQGRNLILAQLSDELFLLARIHDLVVVELVADEDVTVVLSQIDFALIRGTLEGHLQRRHLLIIPVLVHGILEVLNGVFFPAGLHEQFENDSEVFVQAFLDLRLFVELVYLNSAEGTSACCELMVSLRSVRNCWLSGLPIVK